MQMVFAIVGFQMVGPAAYTEHRVLDPVGVPPHKRAAAGAALGVEVVFVVGQGVMPYDHVHRALFCGDKDIFDHTAIVQHMHFQSAGVGDDVLVDLFAAFCHAKRLGTKLCHCARLLIIWFTPSRRTPECIFHNYDYIIVSHACGQNFLELTANIFGDFLVVLQKKIPMERSMRIFLFAGEFMLARWPAPGTRPRRPGCRPGLPRCRYPR